MPDVHVLRVEEFRSGDYLKLRLRGTKSPASFSGLLFDDELAPSASERGRAGAKAHDTAKANRCQIG